MPEGVKARPSRVLGINKAVFHETWPDVVLHELASTYGASSPQFVRGKQKETSSTRGAICPQDLVEGEAWP